jgi:hypothetical protein
MKILTVTLIVFLFFILCIYLEKFETFADTPAPSPTMCVSKNIDLAKCNDNDINNKLINNINNLNKINMYKELNYDDIKTKLNTKLNTKYTDEEFNLLFNPQKSKLDDLEKEIKSISNDSIFDKLNNSTDYRSVKSHGSYQSLNLEPLTNDKYFISLNGKKKCLESSTLNKNKSIKCNTQNSNQHFNLNIISDAEKYKTHLPGDSNLENHIIKYPFAILKSSSENCVGTKDGSLIVGPCINTIYQRWIPSKNPLTCN